MNWTFFWTIFWQAVIGIPALAIVVSFAVWMIGAQIQRVRAERNKPKKIQ